MFFFFSPFQIELELIVFEEKLHSENLEINELFLFPAEPIGLDWDKLKELLNPNFDWETAVQKVLGNGDSIAEVSVSSYLSLVSINYALP